MALACQQPYKTTRTTHQQATVLQAQNRGAEVTGSIARRLANQHKVRSEGTRDLFWCDIPKKYIKHKL